MWLATEGKRDLRGDAFTGAQLAHASVQAAARLVELNARQLDDQGLGDEARALAATTRHLTERAGTAHE
jgi:formiminotetrahydrofolate cyclodeaminase